MPHETPTLAELQARFQAAIVGGSDDILGFIPPNSRTSNAVLFGVYRFAYVSRLVEVVRNAYPMLARHMRDDAFVRMAERYVARYPSRHANARWYATDVPELLSEGDYADAPVLREIALIERQLDQAFDAVDAPVLDLAALAQHPPETWSDLVFAAHPSVALLTLDTNAFDIWVALKNELPPPDVTVHDAQESFLVWRWDGVPNVRRVSDEERMLWSEAVRGKPFGGLMEMAATYGAPSEAALRVAQYLNGWLSAGLLSEAMLRPREAAKAFDAVPTDRTI
ncbi:DNA-binding domain-containing protein [Hyphomicrobium sp. LHD-15]|uniref:DNA-binding domain-containing protein n=1 Tax=Hyphomicrobium sp. LHD-15 TaxID=3072142 RepID=UPI00280DABE5|nr:DNA-binding domain-containing protein [Hyphomicrobium sp. LHD-15]MDQ8700825.1 DNA-binding domain-containing protein [Hyphomicrobium sp. LHD-15]